MMIMMPEPIQPEEQAENKDMQKAQARPRKARADKAGKAGKRNRAIKRGVQRTAVLLFDKYSYDVEVRTSASGTT